MKNINKLFFIKPYKDGKYLVFSTNYTLQMFKFWIFRGGFVQHNGFDARIFADKPSADAYLKQQKECYIEACKIVKS